MKLYIREMAKTQKQAIDKFTSKTDSIAEHICKIFVHKKSSSDEFWRKEIFGDFYDIINSICNIKTSIGYLSKELISEILFDCFDFIDDHCSNIYKEYIGKSKQIKQYLEAKEIIEKKLVPRLEKDIPKMIKILQFHNKNNDKKISKNAALEITDLIYNIVIKIRENY